jgi:hypothetical protein
VESFPSRNMPQLEASEGLWGQSMFNLEIDEEMFLRRGEHGVRDSDVHPIHSEALQGTAGSLYLLGVTPIMIMSCSAMSQAKVDCQVLLNISGHCISWSVKMWMTNGYEWSYWVFSCRDHTNHVIVQQAIKLH